MATRVYDAGNRVTSLTSGDSSVTYYSYDNANRVTEIQHKTSGGTVLSDYQYGYDAVNTLYQTDTDGTSTAYTYDGADQLLTEVRDNTHSTGYSISYTYDHNQNRLTKTLNSVTDTYSYDAQNKLTGVTGSVTKSYSYDSNGSCTSVTVGSGMSAVTTNLSYDYESRVSGITYPSSATNTFQYNGNDLRTKKVDSSGTRNYITDGDSPAAAVLSDGLATFTPGLSERRSSTSSFYHGDALGSTRSQTSSSQSVTDTKRYDAFGMLVASSGSNPTPFGFVGGSQYQTDADSGLMLLGHRYYDASIGRFISRDPAYAGTNYFAYCENNPLGGTEPEGLDVNDGSATNNSKLIQFVDVDFDPDRWAVVPRTHQYPEGSAIPDYELRRRDGNGPVYPAWPADPVGRKPGQHDRLILPVAPGTTVGGDGVDVDAGWDRKSKTWIKTGGRAVGGVISGNADWSPSGVFEPAIGPGVGKPWSGVGTGDPNIIIHPPGIIVIKRTHRR